MIKSDTLIIIALSDEDYQHGCGEPVLYLSKEIVKKLRDHGDSPYCADFSVVLPGIKQRYRQVMNSLPDDGAVDIGFNSANYINLSNEQLDKILTYVEQLP